MSYKKNLLSIINNNKAKIGIIGLGYVGLPLASIFAKKFKVIGFDNDKEKINFLINGVSYIKHVSNKFLNSKNDKFFPTSNYKNIKNCDIIILCLPTPLNIHKKPDLSFIKNTLLKILDYLRQGQIIILESSTYPGSTKELISPIISKKKFKIGKDFFVGYSPEREDPNNKKFRIQNIPKLCSGLSSSCIDLTNKIYSKVVSKTVKVSNIEIAEFAKIFENTYRSVNIALVNELKMLAKKKNLDMYQIIKAASTKPFGFQAFDPGPGVGGHCIPVDPYYLQWVADKKKVNIKFIGLAGKINDMMPEWIIKETLKLKKIKNALILGVAYKKNIDDMRESPALEFINILTKKKIKTDYHDPYINYIKSRKLNKKFKSVSLKNINKYDVIFLITDHDCFNYNYILKNSKLIIDTRNKFKKEIKGKVFKL